MKDQAASTESSLARRIRLGLITISLVCFLWCQSSAAAFAQKLKAIDPSSLKLDDSPAVPANGSGNAQGGSSPGRAFNDTPIQGRPLGSTFQPINAPTSGGGHQGDAGAGFGASMSPPSDEPAASAQDEDRVNNLEQKAFGCNYHEHEVPDRLDHLEKEVLGAPKDGPIPDRIARLEVKLLGGSGFGAAPSTSSQRLPVSPPVRIGNGGNGGSNGNGNEGGNGNDGGNDGGTVGGNGWLTQPVGSARATAPTDAAATNPVCLANALAEPVSSNATDDATGRARAAANAASATVWAADAAANAAAATVWAADAAANAASATVWAADAAANAASATVWAAGAAATAPAGNAAATTATPAADATTATAALAADGPATAIWAAATEFWAAA